MVRRLLPLLGAGRKVRGHQWGRGQGQCGVTLQVVPGIFLGSWDLEGKDSAHDQPPLSL